MGKTWVGEASGSLESSSGRFPLLQLLVWGQEGQEGQLGRFLKPHEDKDGPEDGRRESKRGVKKKKTKRSKHCFSFR